MIETDKFAKVEIASLAQLRAWLCANHHRTQSFWLVRFKKSRPEKFVDRLAVLDELLCFGWIDGIARKLDAERTMQLISPRQQQAWAKSYKDRAERLIAEGRMTQAGLDAIARSKALGLWDAYAEIDALVCPDDLQAALAREPEAQAFFESAAPSYRRNVLRWIAAAKKPETRQDRIGKTVSFCLQAKKIPQM